MCACLKPAWFASFCPVSSLASTRSHSTLRKFSCSALNFTFPQTKLVWHSPGVPGAPDFGVLGWRRPRLCEPDQTAEATIHQHPLRRCHPERAPLRAKDLWIYCDRHYSVLAHSLLTSVILSAPQRAKDPDDRSHTRLLARSSTLCISDDDHRHGHSAIPRFRNSAMFNGPMTRWSDGPMVRWSDGPITRFQLYHSAIGIATLFTQRK